jgi:hypothetical protein
MITLQRHARYALPDGTRVMARCWETGIAPAEWKLHSDDEHSTPLYRIEGECLHRYVWDASTNQAVLVFCDLVLDDLQPV